MEFRARPYRFHFLVKDPVTFAADLTTTNTFRGALGLLMRSIACGKSCPGAAECERAAECVYARCFAPRQAVAGPSGFGDLPRPFVLLDACGGRSYEPGERFTLDLRLFDGTPVDAFAEALGRLQWMGIGPGRPRIVLERVEELPAEAVGLAPGERYEGRLSLYFLTPMELKHEGRVLREPRFEVILARARDRVSQLMRVYQGGEPEWDFRGMGERARAIRLVRDETRVESVERRSTRTGQRHELGGFVGGAEYAGEFTEFLPVLEAAMWCGVGRHTVWGQGAFWMERFPLVADAVRSGRA